MDYKKILSDELKRTDCNEDDAYERYQIDDVINDDPIDYFDVPDFLLKNVPSEFKIIWALQELAGRNDDHCVMLVPIRTFLQIKLMITSQRLDELISDNAWIQSWIEYIKAMQEIKIMETFSAGNMEDSKLKWLLWAVLGESVDLSMQRNSISTEITAETTLTKYGTDS